MSKKKETNERKKRIKELQEQSNKLQGQINELTYAEEIEVVLPKCRALVGTCLKSTYGDYRYAKLLEIIENPKLGIYYLMEVFYVTEEGSTYFMTDNCYPYTNKEWWDTDIPISGWKRISEKEYQLEKAKTWQEFSTMKILRKFTNKRS